ncbi:Molybdopterin binding protein [Rhizopus microsporus var. microsporus]|uniref:Molybdopterin binding protein n=2 Tax=Rhizopus microsporus TaxID=58291 RepID=A0A2G4T185_RHIZD|nr:Molybdopterin binding protein [Rhizopus microsporus ATCC 52813]ORE09452.1 Molybdopterin binding protein [Rhizopus microsporus var. microsporus]PHZ14436.1 Molybdopterin binding protein [Rhizopus microsporus ATCC 52813]
MSKKTITAACCVIGDEILSGKTQDANSHYLAKTLFDLGIELRCIQVIGDNKQDIINSVRELSSTYNIVFTSGGIGPTHDDITYESIASAYGLQLNTDKDTLEFFKRQAEKRNMKWTKSHVRMATFPYPAELLREKKGIPFPIVVVNKNIHILPGVPMLFKILLDSLKPRLAVMSGSRFYRCEIATRKTEVSIAEVLADIQARSDDAKIGSYPFGKNQDGIQVVITVSGKEQSKVDKVTREIMEKTEGWLYNSVL